tara:strand:- start:338 stop:1318 length:981 start_codon:yes stop_codon:yes gene_type:complete
MALQTSGQIKFSEISTEIGRGSTDEHSLEDSSRGTYATINTQNAVADRPDTGVPHAISEWYRYDHNLSSYVNDYYWNFASDAQGIGFTRGGTTQQSNNDLSVSMWVRPEWANSDTNSLLLMLSPDATNTTNRFFIMYDYGLNRVVLRMRTNGVNSRGTHFSLNDSGNNAITGTGTGKWTASNVGNVNSDGLCHIVVTYDLSASSGAAAFKMYWNGSELPNTVSNLTGTQTTFDYNRVYINRANNGVGGARKTKYDEVVVFNNKLLNSTEVSNLYNSGVPQSPSEAGEDDNVMFYFDAETSTPSAVDGDDYANTWTNNTNAGSRTAY